MKKVEDANPDELRAEYKRSDFGELKRGKYAGRILEKSNVVVFDPDVAAAFPNDKTVSEEEYDRAIEFLNRLIDEVGTDDRRPLYGLLDALGTVIHSYEEQHLSMPDCDAIEMLCHFMEEHGLEASDLPEIGSEEAVSDVISGGTELSVRQIRALAHRFHVSPAVFI